MMLAASGRNRSSSRFWPVGGHDDSDADEHNYYKPDAWKVALEATHERAAPTAAIKAAAQWLVSVEFIQQGTGWLLLTQMGVILGSFAQAIPRSLCLLSLVIFMLEATLKFLRNWAHRSFFVDVPCAYVALHEASYNTLADFERSLKLVLPLESLLFASYIYYAIHHLVHVNMCKGVESESDYCVQQGGDTLVCIILLCSFTVLAHGFTSVLAWWTFNVALGNSRLRNSSLRGYGGAPYRSEDKQSRLLCLTWWVHLARHQHLSAVVANKELMNCNLPGHWFETVDQLKGKLKDCVDMVGDHVITSEGPLWDSLTMALNAIVCLANKGEDEKRSEFLSGGGFDLLVRVVREGKFSSCRALAAAAIAIFASRTAVEAQKEDVVNLSAAVIPLKRLARSKESELKEVALGALLNIVLNDHQLNEVVKQFDCEDGIVHYTPGRMTFMRMVMICAYASPTPRCQELAIGILARLAGRSVDARNMLLGESSQKPTEFANLVELLKHGLSTGIKASAAGVLAEFEVKDIKTITKITNIADVESCIETLLNALNGEPRVAYPSARALSNLAQGKIGKKMLKEVIIDKGGITKAVEVLKRKPGETASPPQDSEEASSVRRADAASALTQEHVQAEAARLLWVLLYQNPASQELIAEAQVIPDLVTLLASKQPNVYTHAISALTGMAWRCKVNQDAIADHGNQVIPRMVAILRDKDKMKEEKAVEKIVLALIGVVDKHRRNRDMLLQAGVMAVLESVKGKSEIYKGKAIERTDALIKALNEELGE